jgi:hypothetical protein
VSPIPHNPDPWGSRRRQHHAWAVSTWLLVGLFLGLSIMDWVYGNYALMLADGAVALAFGRWNPGG